MSAGLNQVLGQFPSSLVDALKNAARKFQVYDSQGRAVANTDGVPTIANLNAHVSAVTVAGNDVRGTITYTTDGTGVVAGGKYFRITFANPFSVSEIAAGAFIEISNLSASVSAAQAAASANAVPIFDASNNLVAFDVYSAVIGALTQAGLQWGYSVSV